MIIKPFANITRTPQAYVTFNGYPVKLEDILFFDIETAPEFENLGELHKHDKGKYHLFKEKVASLKKFDDEYKEQSETEIYENYTGLMAEYNKIVCISFGWTTEDGFKTGSIALDGINFKSEKEVVENFAVLLEKSKKKFICGANILLFDIPLFCKKCFIYGICPPPVFWKHESKAWTATAIDISEIWRGKARMRDARLKTICHLMGIKSPKDEMEGKDVGKFFYEGKIENIADYCERDTEACYKSLLKFQSLEQLK